MPTLDDPDRGVSGGRLRPQTSVRLGRHGVARREDDRDVAGEPGRAREAVVEERVQVGAQDRGKELDSLVVGQQLLVCAAEVGERRQELAVPSARGITSSPTRSGAQEAETNRWRGGVPAAVSSCASSNARIAPKLCPRRA